MGSRGPQAATGTIFGTARKKRNRLGDHLRRRGFDQTTYDRSTGYYSPRCSQCQALVINGVATHERGCSNAK